MTRGRIYWANALFTEADREFNLRWATVLRSAGYDVFLPQEAAANHLANPSTIDILMADASKIRASDALVACIDQETIDAGVACEIGMAFELGIPVIGVYTDIRRARTGEGRMYKNLFVLGAIALRGAIVSDPSSLVSTLDLLLKTPPQPYGSQEEVQKAISQVEQSYRPPWSAAEHILSAISAAKATRVLDFGCGGSRLADALSGEIDYFGYDIRPEAIVDAKQGAANPRAVFGCTWAEVEEWARQRPPDLVVMSFCLHDIVEKDATLTRLRTVLAPSGHLAILDLARDDFPHLTAHLRRRLLAPFNASDHRLGLDVVSKLALLGFQVEALRVHTPGIVFLDPESLMLYLDAFGITRGADLPLGIAASRSEEARRLIEHAVAELDYPFSDQRVFIEVRCQLEVRS